MDKKTYLLSTVLTAVAGAVLLIMEILRLVIPAVILPPFSIPNLVLVSVVSLFIEYCLAPGAKRNWVLIILSSALVFGVLPLAADLVSPLESLKLGAAGCVTFTVTAFVYSSLLSRLATGRSGKSAAAAGAAGIWLASQALMGILL